MRWKPIGVSPRTQTVNWSRSLCLCRKARIQRNHVACALLVWSRLKTLAYQMGKTVYQIKHGMLSDYLPIATQASVRSNDSCVSPGDAELVILGIVSMGSATKTGDREARTESTYKPFMKILESGYQIRSARVEEIPLLSQIEQSAASLFIDTPYAFLINDAPLPLDFVQQQFQAGRVWVAVNCRGQSKGHLDETVVGDAIACEVDDTLYLQQIDVAPEHGRRGIGSALVNTVCAWAKAQGYRIVSLSTFRDIPWNAPFYSKLGFRPVDESELTTGFQQIRLKELAAGLPIFDRAIMQRVL